jgi:nucleoid DNA-binding protein
MVKGHRELVSSLATEYELSLKDIEKIVSAQFKLLAKTMAKGKNETVRCPYLGAFKATKQRIKYVTDAKRKASKS